MILTQTRRAVMVSALFAIAGCSGAGSSGAPSAGNAPSANYVHAGSPFATLSELHARALPRSLKATYKASKSLVFEGDQEQAAVNVYQTADVSKNPSPIATIHVHQGCPYGMTLDQTGTLYVADNCGGNDVEEYPKGSTTESTSITDGISNPLGLAMDSKHTLYVSNYPAEITEYTYGSQSPAQTISGQGLSDPFGLAVDKSNNLYIADFGASAVFEVAYGTTTVTNLNLSGCGEPLGVSVDEKKDYLWVTCGAGNTLNVYKIGQTSPFETLSGHGDPYAISTENKGKPIDTTAESDLGTETIYFYKKGQYTPYASLSNGISLATGVLIAKP